jgi:CheY-like chemotaxis protein
VKQGRSGVTTGAIFDNFRVLIVEDNGHMRLLLRELLNVTGIREISEAADGAAALKVLAWHKCDLILSDMAMAPMDGIEFTRHIRTHEGSPNPFVPIIMVTGHTEKERVMAARDAGVTEFLAKPVTPKNLYARIAEIVERPRAFVRTESYFGPDRRRKTLESYMGPWRRHDDYDVEGQ